MATQITSKIIVTLFAISCWSNVSFSASSLSLHASATCLTCLRDEATADRGSLKGLVQQVNIFEKDVRKAAGDDPASAATGDITTNRDIIFEKSLKFRGSGAVMVSPCHVLTARHGVFGDENPASGADFSVTLSIGKDSSGKPFKIHGDPVAWGPDNLNGNDWALIHLKNCAGVNKSVGWMTPGRAAEHTEVGLAGIQGDKTFGSKWTASCQLTTESIDHMYLHNCPTTHGTSGNPLITAGEDGSPVMRALNIGSVKDVPGIQKNYSTGIANVAIDAAWIMQQDKVADKIQASVNWYKRNYPTEENPQIAMARKVGTQVAFNEI